MIVQPVAAVPSVTVPARSVPVIDGEPPPHDVSAGAVPVDRVPARYVSGEGVRMVWLLTREAWLARRGGG